MLATKKRIAEYLDRFAKMPPEQRALRMAISLRFLNELLIRTRGASVCNVSPVVNRIEEIKQ